MTASYAYAFDVHQRPIKTRHVHKFFMERLPYFWYLPLVAFPVDIVVHTLQVCEKKGALSQPVR